MADGNGNGAAWFRWIVTGILGVTGVLVSVIWLQLLGAISDIRTDTKSLTAIMSDIRLVVQAHSDEIKALGNKLDEHLKESPASKPITRGLERR